MLQKHVNAFSLLSTHKIVLKTSGKPSSSGTNAAAKTKPNLK
jgi:hypothetical protein